MSENRLGLTKTDDEKIAVAYEGGDHPFHHQDLDDANIQDAEQWLASGELVGIVSEVHGGIIGYVHHSHADDINTILNLHAIDRMKETSK